MKQSLSHGKNWRLMNCGLYQFLDWWMYQMSLALLRKVPNEMSLCPVVLSDAWFLFCKQTTAKQILDVLIYTSRSLAASWHGAGLCGNGPGLALCTARLTRADRCKASVPPWLLWFRMKGLGLLNRQRQPFCHLSNPTACNLGLEVHSVANKACELILGFTPSTTLAKGTGSLKISLLQKWCELLRNLPLHVVLLNLCRVLVGWKGRCHVPSCD